MPKAIATFHDSLLEQYMRRTDRSFKRYLPDVFFKDKDGFIIPGSARMNVDIFHGDFGVSSYIQLFNDEISNQIILLNRSGYIEGITKTFFLKIGKDIGLAAPENNSKISALSAQAAQQSKIDFIY